VQEQERKAVALELEHARVVAGEGSPMFKQRLDHIRVIVRSRPVLKRE
jgi:hypothetical protein